ncbi:MAG: ATP-grasp domain-containing protein [Bdellovibrionota bacterium]
MKQAAPLKKTVGILGGGQLAWMLASAAHDLGYPVVGFVKSLDEPLAQLSFVELYTPESIENFARAIDVLCFESEFFEERWVEQIMSFNPSVSVKPGLTTMRLLRDKLDQKRLFEKLGIAQSPYVELRESSLETDLSTAAAKYPSGFVVKRARGGYDGKGNFFIEKISSLAKNEALREFCSKAFSEASRIYAEKRVDFQRELAIVAVASQAKGEFISYPLMLTRQVSGTCQEVWGPAVTLGIEAECALQASRWSMSVAKHCPDLACFAIEFFWDKHNGLLINELAPRVHNSGHFTQLEGDRSQFHNHIRSLMDESLVPFTTQGFYLMRNLLAPKELSTLRVDPEEVEELRTLWRGELAWYGKTHLAPGRKMGHVNLKEEGASALEKARVDLERRESGFWARLKDQTRI